MDRETVLSELRQAASRISAHMDGVHTLTPPAIAFARGDIGRRFREIRRALDLTQAEAVEVLDLGHRKGPGYLGQWESGRYESVDLDVLVATAWLAAKLGYRLRWFILGELPVFESGPVPLFTLEQAATITGTVPATLTSLAAADKTVGIRIGPYLRFTPAQLVALIEAGAIDVTESDTDNE